MPRRAIDRRAFLGTSAGAFICTIGGREIAVRSPQDVTKADAAARAVGPAAGGGADGAVPHAAARARRRPARVLDPGALAAVGPDPHRPRRLARRPRPR